MNRFLLPLCVGEGLERYAARTFRFVIERHGGGVAEKDLAVAEDLARVELLQEDVVPLAHVEDAAGVEVQIDLLDGRVVEAHLDETDPCPRRPPACPGASAPRAPPPSPADIGGLLAGGYSRPSNSSSLIQSPD